MTNLRTLMITTTQTASLALPGMVMADMKIVENAANSPIHMTLIAAVQAAGLVDTLPGEGPFTVFARYG